MKGNKRLWLSAAVLSGAAAMMLYGGLRGELPVIFNKAVNICLECIGLG